jgi:hypothetical protein
MDYHPNAFVYRNIHWDVNSKSVAAAGQEFCAGKFQRPDCSPSDAFIPYAFQCSLIRHLSGVMEGIIKDGRTQRLNWSQSERTDRNKPENHKPSERHSKRRLMMNSKANMKMG